MTREEEINKIIKDEKLDTNKISDGYHTFGDLYDHRIRLFITVCKIKAQTSFWNPDIWRSKKNSEGEEWEGWFLLGVNKSKGNQITYHLPNKYWEETNFAETIPKAESFDGHTSADVLERLKKL